MDDRMLHGLQRRHDAKASASAVARFQEAFSAQGLHVFGHRADAGDSKVPANLAKGWRRFARGATAVDHAEHRALAFGRFRVHR
jgi:hypothetical protein